MCGRQGLCDSRAETASARQKLHRATYFGGKEEAREKLSVCVSGCENLEWQPSDRILDSQLYVYKDDNAPTLCPTTARIDPRLGFRVRVAAQYLNWPSVDD